MSRAVRRARRSGYRSINAIDAVAESDPRIVRVRFVAHTEDDPARLVVIVDDSGPGLSAAEAEHAFERGWSTKALPEDAPRGTGRGIGLALVAQVARRHGGDVITGDSEFGGASFTVTLRSAP